ncbi:GNAT family N-acetyltransferase [Sphingomonas nostoxanthinifaciens]|uniref:GNAT family N-acetyltransferase n=1 Tax=Sphingomonas nostoxanthinifaciens TaxID=2872652 RepID=UPI001CC1F2D0|nr:GNAT family N-acetyltransferase [Sphingomonas nostoxanthinifaciens]UAK23507.1 GNAT family N-acetyltransferase [Sphingomonas nostoxanthinifaciens]
MDWAIRQASAGDSGRLALIGAATFLETFADILDGDAIVAHCRDAHAEAAYSAYLAAGASAWLAETTAGGAPIGFALLAAADIPGMNPTGDIELKRIYSLSRFHGQGLGAALMACAMEEAARRGAKRLLLGVYKCNARAIAFYEKAGFEPIAERRFRVGGRDYDDLVLARPVERP